MHLHPVLASQTATELQRERTAKAVAASEIRRRLAEQGTARAAARRARRRRRLLARLRPSTDPRYAA
jgi:hypothetical protein